MANRLTELDALRGIAALVVVLFHFTTRYNQLYGYDEAPLISVPLGHYGVQLFFVVSGFVIFLTLNSCKHPFDFLVSRFARLYPVYWGAVIITFTSVTLFELEGRGVSFFHAIVNLSMLQGFIGAPDVDGVYWTLKWELVFYFWMFVVFALRIEKHIVPIIVAWLVMQMLVWLVGEHYRQVPGLLKLILLTTYGNLFVAGIVFYRIKYGASGLLDHCILVLSLVSQWLQHGGEAFTVTLGIFVLFYLFCHNKLGFVAVKPLAFLGTISYSLYLIHEYVGWIIIRELISLGVDTNITIVSVLLIVLCLASLLNLLIEKPAMRKIRGYYADSLRPHVVKSDIWATRA